MTDKEILDLIDQLIPNLSVLVKQRILWELLYGGCDNKTIIISNPEGKQYGYKIDNVIFDELSRPNSNNF